VIFGDCKEENKST